MYRLKSPTSDVADRATIAISRGIAMATTPRSLSPRIGGDAIEIDKELEASRLQLLASHFSYPNGLNEKRYALGQIANVKGAPSRSSNVISKV